MPTELEELVEFLHHGNTQIRQIAAENLLSYSQSDPSLFKRNQLEPIKDLKLLIKDYDPIKKNAITMLINLSGDMEIRENLAKDDQFVELLLSRITNQKEPFANDLCMLFANLSKSDSLARLFTLKRTVAANLGGSANAMDQLMDVFVRGRHDQSTSLETAPPAWNTSKAGADYDYLAYVFADLAKHGAGAAYLTAPQTYDGVHPLSKLLPFTAVAMPLPRRLGVASAIKNVGFAGQGAGRDASNGLLAPDLSLLTYILLPLADGADEYADDEQDELLDDLQLLDESVRRDPDVQVLKTHLETLLVLSSSKAGRDTLRQAGTYYVVRECHKAVQDPDVQEACDRLVQVLQRGEPEEGGEGGGEGDGEGTGKVLEEIEKDSDDDKIVDIA